ncbi:SOS response-associated peptidase family protein [Pantoea ananatis]|uniref:SOS response-associated peptidase family protein n=1 Tax=Pantoea ananas TaxID=553 RepID=UPI002361864E|nr:SOS response-associated peptidase family protein [Pantoea ananatis]
MCGRFAQYSCRDAYFEAAGITPEELPFDAEPLGRYNVAPGTRVMLLNQREGQLHFDPVFWGYKPDWWHKAMLINARGETAASGRMFKPLWQHGRAVVPANGWFEWARTDEGKQPYFICHRSRQPLFFAAIGKAPFGRDHGHEGFVIVTAGSNQGMVDIHDRRPLALQPDSVREWLSEDTSAERASEIARDLSLPEGDFSWHKVGQAVGNIHNQGEALTEPAG